jgi:hypothetical protein
MNIGDPVEVLYLGEWTPGKVVSAENLHRSNPAAKEQRPSKPLWVYAVDTPKGRVNGVAVEYGTMRVKE